MDKIDVLKIIRANDEKFKKHIEKIHKLEERERKINYINRMKSLRRIKRKIMIMNVLIIFHFRLFIQLALRQKNLLRK